MKADDWRISPSAEIAPLYEAETARWASSLHWDTRESWTIVEAAREAGGLPGFVVRDARGAIHGWTFFVRSDAAIQIGAFAADSQDTTVILLDAIAASPHAASVSALVLFAFSDAPGLTAELQARGFVVERYRYLQTDLRGHAWLKPCATGGAPCATGGAPCAAEGAPCATEGAPCAAAVAHGFSLACWRDEDHDGVPTLLASAYPALDPARPFARHGRPHEWAAYVRQLVTTTGCGTFLPRVSYVAPDASAGHPAAAALVTQLAKDTVHVAQVAVAPAARGRGLARRVVTASLAAAEAAGYARATLLVSERNVTAGRVYADLGFEEVAVFVSAVCDQPRRSKSAALETGGAMTLR